MPHQDQSDYISRQDVLDAQLKKAWAEADPGFLSQASKLGINGNGKCAHYDGGHETMAREFDEHKLQLANPVHAPFVVLPDMAATLDTHVDRIVEKYPTEEAVVRQIAADLQIPMQVEIERNRAMMLGQIVGHMIHTEGKNMLARIHALLHSIPRLAAINGFSSMRRSSVACGKSPEWIRRSRNEWCGLLEIPIPEDGQKSDEAKAKYKANALSGNHWKKQLFKPTEQPQNILCQQKPIKARAN